MLFFGATILLFVFAGTVHFKTIFKLALAVAQETVVPVLLPETNVTIEKCTTPNVRLVFNGAIVVRYFSSIITFRKIRWSNVRKEVYERFPALRVLVRLVEPTPDR